jgi:hypothetical protein
MWMCNNCQETNNDNISVCTRCGGIQNQSALPERPVADTLPISPQPDDYYNSVPSGQIPVPGSYSAGQSSRIDDIRTAVTRQPLMGVVLGILLIAELIPTFMYGLWSFCVGMFDLLIFTMVVMEIWKWTYLTVKGVRTTGIVTDVRYTRGTKGEPRAYATVQYLVNGAQYWIKDDMGGYPVNYCSQGQQVTVMYDSLLPNFARLDMSSGTRWFTIIVAGIFGLAIYWAVWIPRFIVTANNSQ